MLRRAIVAYGLLCVAVAALLLFAVHAALVLGLYLGINGAVIAASNLLFGADHLPAAR